MSMAVIPDGGLEGRPFPRLTARPVLTIEGGEEVVVYKRKGPDWARVKTADGGAWWVEAKHLIEGDA